MTISRLDLQQTIILSGSVEDFSTDSFESFPTKFISSFDLKSGSYTSSIKALNKILRRVTSMDLPGKDHVEAYLRHLTRRNRRPKTLYSRWGAIVLFLGMIREGCKSAPAKMVQTDSENICKNKRNKRE
jgi:hypothetical protein